MELKTRERRLRHGRVVSSSRSDLVVTALCMMIIVYVIFSGYVCECICTVYMY